MELSELDEKFGKEFWKDIVYEIVSNMNPWDIDIEELTKRYTEKINEMKILNLKIPADVIVVCAVLLRMKAEMLKIGNENEYDVNEIGNENEESDVNYKTNEYKTNELLEYDEEIKLIPKRRIKGKISINELIEAIDEVLKKPNKKILKNLEKKEIKGIEFNIEESIKEIIDKIYEKIIQRLSKEKQVKFSEISDRNNRKNFVKDFLAILFLINNKKIDAIQEENFGEIYLIPI
ncbi:MAG: segregation/condensation protein A [Candidatus Altarchaeaceae archaeon]